MIRTRILECIPSHVAEILKGFLTGYFKIFFGNFYRNMIFAGFPKIIAARILPKIPPQVSLGKIPSKNRLGFLNIFLWQIF